MSYKRYQNKVVDLNITKEVYYKKYFQKIIIIKKILGLVKYCQLNYVL